MDISRTCSPSGAMPVQRRFLRMESESTVMTRHVTPGHRHQPSLDLADIPTVPDSDLHFLPSLALAALRNQGLPMPMMPASVATPKPDIYDNAQFEHITCAGLPKKYDGSPDNLIPMLTFTFVTRMKCGTRPHFSCTTTYQSTLLGSFLKSH
jgi:hypothetical protein